MSRIRNLFGLVLIGIFTTILFIINVFFSFDSYTTFYNDNKDVKKHLVHTLSENIYYSEPLNSLLNYTGFETGYGFFAPNVSSDFVLVFDVTSATDSLIIRRHFPTLRNKESIIRFSTFFGSFLELLEDSTSNFDKNYTQIFLKQCALDIKKEYPEASVVKTKLYLYDFPTLKNYKENSEVVYFKISEYEF